MKKLLRGALAVLVTAGALLLVPSSALADGSDNPSFTLNKQRVFLHERSGTHISVKLDTRPTDPWVKVTVSTPDTSVFMLPGAEDDSDTDEDTNLILWFHWNNWHVSQNAYVWAVQDSDRIDELEDITFSADGHDDATADVVVLEPHRDEGTPTSVNPQQTWNSVLNKHVVRISFSGFTPGQNAVYRRNISRGETNWINVEQFHISNYDPNKSYKTDREVQSGINLYRVGSGNPSDGVSALNTSHTEAAYFNPNPGGA